MNGFQHRHGRDYHGHHAIRARRYHADLAPHTTVIGRSRRGGRVARRMVGVLGAAVLVLVAGCTGGTADAPAPTLPPSTTSAPMAGPPPTSAEPNPLPSAGAVAPSGPSAGASSSSGPTSSSGAGTQLFGGGRRLFPGRMFVALYGQPDVPGLGVLGAQDLPASISRAKTVAASYDEFSSVPVVPAFELIATTALDSPGAGGQYTAATSVPALRPWVDKATAAGLYVILDLQPGRADFLTQAKLYSELLALPNVGLALDPEWRLTPDQVPLEQIGSVDAAEVNKVVDWLAALTVAHDLPQKLLVLHQFRNSMIRSEAGLDLSRDQVAVLIHMDGLGAPEVKDETWAAVVAAAPSGVTTGPLGRRLFLPTEGRNRNCRTTPLRTPRRRERAAVRRPTGRRSSPVWACVSRSAPG